MNPSITVRDIYRRSQVNSNPYPEYPGAAVTTTNIVYSSVNDPNLTTLKATVVYPTSGTNLPVLLAIHGYHETAADLDNNGRNFARWARLGYFVIGVEMRGSNGSSGSFNDGGRETMDCYDVIQYVVSNYSSIIAPNRFSIIGFSNGGGIALLLACRYPDLFQAVCDFFGISDYGTDPTFGWYQEEPTRQAGLQGTIGGTPAAKPDEYASRYSKSGIATNFTGFLSMFHDDQDSAVQVDHSQRVKAMYDSAGRTDYYYNESNPSSVSRWLHQYPSDSNRLDDAEPFWKNKPKIQTVQTIATSGTLKILGMLKTKRFTVYMNDGNYLNAGQSRFGTLVYNTLSNSYQVTNDSANYATVSIVTSDGLVATGVLSAGETYTFTPTTITVDGDIPTVWFDAGGKLLLSGSDVTAVADKTGGPQYQGYTWTFLTNRPALLSTDINSRPAIQFDNANSEGFVGAKLASIQNINKFTFIGVNTGTIVDHGNAATTQTQFEVLSGGQHFYAINNAGSAFGQDAGAASYLVRSTIYDGTQATNATKLIRRENKAAQSVSFTGTIPTTTESGSTSVMGIGKRSYSTSFFAGKIAEFMIFTSVVANIGNKEDLLKTKYAI